MKLLYVMPFKVDVTKWNATGDCNIARNILKNLPKDWEVDVIGNFGSTDGDPSFYQDMYNINRVIDVSEFADYRNYSQKTFKYLQGLEDFNYGDYDLIQVHNSNPGIISRINEYLDEYPVVLTLHSPPEVPSFQFYQRDAYIHFLTRPNSMFMCVSSSQVTRTLTALKYDETQYGKPHISYILNGISTTEYSSGLYYDIGTIGRPSRSKNVLESLKCVEFITRTTGGRGFYVGSKSSYEGDSEEEIKYCNEIHKLLEDNPQIEWFPYLSSEEIQNLLSKSKCYIALSTIETFGLTVCEAIMQGTPAIGFDINGIGEIIEEGVTGYKFIKKPSKWTTRYSRSLDIYNNCLKLDRNSVRAHAKESFSIDRMVSEYVELYNKMLERED